MEHGEVIPAECAGLAVHCGPAGGWVLNYLLPAVRRASVEPVYGPVIDTLPFALLRAVLVSGEAAGPLALAWGFDESDTPDMANCEPFTIAPGWSGAHDRERLSWLTMPLGPAAGRKRYLRAGLQLAGGGLIVAGLLIELYESLPWPIVGQGFGQQGIAAPPIDAAGRPMVDPGAATGRRKERRRASSDPRSGGR